MCEKEGEVNEWPPLFAKSGLKWKSGLRFGLRASKCPDPPFLAVFAQEATLLLNLERKETRATTKHIFITERNASNPKQQGKESQGASDCSPQFEHKCEVLAIRGCELNRLK